MRCNALSSRTFLMATFALALSACNGNSGPTTDAPGLPLPAQALARAQTQAPLKRTHHHGASSKIQHVVIVVQENRSFNNLFYGFPGAKTTKYGYDSSGQKIKLQPVGLETTWDIDHSSSVVLSRLQRHGQLFPARTAG